VTALRALRWLVHDTFDHARATGIHRLTLAVTAVCVLVCLTVSVQDGAEIESGTDALLGTRVDLLFGGFQFDLPGHRPDAVRALQAALAAWVAGAGGLLLSLAWTAALLPAFVQPAAVSVLLAKPLPRWGLLAGKCLGVLAFVATQALIFLGATWLAVVVRTGVCDGRYFLCLPLLLLHFSIFFAFSAMLAVATRSTTASLFGSVLFWLVCAAVNFARHAVHGLPHLAGLPASCGRGAEVAYWVLPKPLDLHTLVADTLGADRVAGGWIDLHALAGAGLWSPGLSVLTSGLCALALFGVAAYDFQTAEY
jgi:hypothetical protein